MCSFHFENCCNMGLQVLINTAAIMLGRDKRLCLPQACAIWTGQKNFHADTPLPQQRAGKVSSHRYSNISSRCLPNLFLEVYESGLDNPPVHSSVTLPLLLKTLISCSLDSSVLYCSEDSFLTPRKRWGKQVVLSSCYWPVLMCV